MIAAIVAASLVFVVFACEVSSIDTPGDGDSGLDGAGLDKAICPASEPDAGSACLLPSGTTCQFGACGARIARCDRGSWTFAANASPHPPCPTAPPAEDDPCPACWPSGSTCTYAPETCSVPDGGEAGATPNTAVARCEGQVWKLAFYPCLDSGADVQRDADADAD